MPKRDKDGKLELNGKTSMVLVLIPGGSFQMGSEEGEKDEQPVHDVEIPAFFLSKYELTQAQWRHLTEENPSYFHDDQQRPLENVSFEEAYALGVSLGLRLPTEAEWEYAARAGTKTRYWWGDDVGKNKANCSGCGSQWDNKQTAPVGSFEANPWGLHDMAGNVWEWVQDCKSENYEVTHKDGRAWEQGNCAMRMIRGGSWNDKPVWMRSANRGKSHQDCRYNSYGFRLAQDL